MRNINLLPESYRPAPRFELKRFIRLLTVSILTLSVILASVFLWMEKANYEKTLFTTRDRVTSLEQQVNAAQDESTKLQNLKNLVTTIETIENSTISKIEVLDDLSKHTPTNVSISRLTVSSEAIVIDGQAVNLETVSLYLESLNSWDKYHGFFIPQLNIVDGQYVFQVQGRLRGGE